MATRPSSLVRASAVLLATACAHSAPSTPPPDPARIHDLRIIAQGSSACPGAAIHTTYQALLTDGVTVPLQRADIQSLLDRTSPDAAPTQDGNWKAQRDPRATISTGFRLTATLRGRPEVTRTLVVPPVYDCLPHDFSFSGSWGGAAGGSGGNGPDVRVRLTVIPSPFFDSLYLATIQADGSAPSFVVANPVTVGSRTWLRVSSQGGDGATGSSGSDGVDGPPGSSGCPGLAGGNGLDGSDGGPGGDGGSGGRITVEVPADQRELANLVQGYSWGGSGGSGGAGGHGGRGGMGGRGLFDANNQPCADGPNGSPGRDGSQGRSGFSGGSGGRAIVVAASTKD